MNDLRKDELIRLSLQRELTAEEESWLEEYFAAQPGGRASWEEERALNRVLQTLADVPVSSNFTARVLHAVELDEARDERKRHPRANSRWRRMLPRFALVSVALLVAAWGLHFRQQHLRNEQARLAEQTRLEQRMRLAQELAKLARISPDLADLRDPEVLADFDAINQLRQASPSDDDKLLIALQ
jgi:hypothetical protein